jgi:hypothetical protein
VAPGHAFACLAEFIMASSPTNRFLSLLHTGTIHYVLEIYLVYRPELLEIL